MILFNLKASINFIHRLDCNPLFISAVGDDHLGHSILAHSSKLDKSLINMSQGCSTATYCLTLKDTGDLWTGIGDMDIHFSVTPERILQCKQHIEKAPLVVLDGNFSQETIGTYYKK